jgi:hypothetical protein
MCLVADLVHFARCVVDSDNATYIVIAFSSSRWQQHDKAPNGPLSRCRLVSTEARQRPDVVRRVVAMWPCCLAYKPILQLEPSDNVTSRPAARKFAVWRTSLATGRQDESATTRLFVLLLLAPTRRTKVVQISHYRCEIRFSNTAILSNICRFSIWLMRNFVSQNYCVLSV